MSKVRRYKATLVPKVLRAKTFSGRLPQTHDEKFQVCEKDVADMMPKMAGLDFCYNHDRKDVVGKVVASFRNPDTNSWDVEYEIDGSTTKGADMIGWIEQGKMKGVSLQHLWGKNEPLEVSMCWRGMRDGSVIYSSEEAVAASKTRGLICWDSNQNCYTRESSEPLDTNTSDLAVAASVAAESEYDIIIFDIMMQQPSVAASFSAAAAPEGTSPPPAAAAAVPAPAAAQASPDVQQQQAAAPGTDLKPADELTKEEFFKRYTDAKARLTYGGILKNSDKAILLESIGQLEVESKQQAADRAALEARLEALESKARKEREAIEADLRQKAEIANASARQKVGDLIETLACDEPGVSENAKAVIASLNATQLELFSKCSDSVKASKSNSVQFPVLAEKYMDDFMLQRKAQREAEEHQQMRMSQMSAPAAAAAASSSSTPIAASYSLDRDYVPRGTMAIAASNSIPSYRFGMAHSTPIMTMAIMGSKSARAPIIGPGGSMKKYRAAAVSDSFERSNAGKTWVPGAGANWNHETITNDVGVQRGMFSWMEETQPGEGTGNQGVMSFKKRELFQDGNNYSAALEYCRSSRVSIPIAGDREYMQGGGGLVD